MYNRLCYVLLAGEAEKNMTEKVSLSLRLVAEKKQTTTNECEIGVGKKWKREENVKQKY